ncbi:hypothetical protein SAMN05192558_11248 [Actinokineospora alba]|uniref:DUF6801 domain-containing protein n=1 Tax=Actinokineospora alba TaxID=504798 RepID=A0A1H0UTC2_9PSEU|nr:DUF6801 domain-containing protein [Actinokineospora alba]TDP69080.1 hypothetical protein C8E96_4651 [Actinokineospora alba]SDI79121.1 hypothetical protein SAMN05421871_107356 [Actinokineospora alba]SDP69341.1 hypothetical protein SAMN05192558_11248 [Actinokineospora alba]
MKSTKLAAGLSGVLAAGMVAAGLLVGAGTGAAAQQVDVDKTLDFSCPFPLLGMQTLKTRIQATFTLPAAPGDPVKTSNFKTTATVPATSTVGLREVAAATLEGTADAAVNVATGGANLNIRLPGLAVAKTTIPESGPFAMAVTGSVPEFAPEPGPVSVTMKGYTAFVSPKKADGSYTGIGDIVSPCTLVPGQNPELLSFVAGGGGSTTVTTSPPPNGVKYGYAIKGKSNLKNLTGDVPIFGTIDAELVLATKQFTAALALNPTTANLTIMGFLPVVSKVEFENVGQTSGNIDATGVLRSASKVTIKLPQVSLFGFPISQSADCKTVAPSDIALQSAADFDVIAGGRLTGTYAIAALKGCGGFNDYISGFVAADGNKLDLTLTAK